MSKQDFITKKKRLSGNKKSHAMNHSHRVWNLNLQTVTIILPNGQRKKVKVTADKNPEKGTDCGKDTNDKLFLLLIT